MKIRRDRDGFQPRNSDAVERTTPTPPTREIRRGHAIACIILVVSTLGLTSQGFATTITFDSPIDDDGRQAYGNNSFYAERSFKLTPTLSGMQRNHPGLAGPLVPNNGTIEMSIFSTSFSVLTYDFDEPFALLSIDLGEYSAHTNFAGIPVEISIIGTTVLGETISGICSSPTAS